MARNAPWNSWSALGGLALAAVALLAWQRLTADQLRARVAVQRERASEHSRLEQEHQRLLAEQVPADELTRLRAERSAVAGLIAEIAAMKRRADEAARTPGVRSSTATVPLSPPSSLREGPLDAGLWRNAGQATPEAALESALWAAAGGNVDALARLLALDPDAQAKAAMLLAQLPPALRSELATPERLVALLTAGNVPLGRAEVLTQVPVGALADQTQLSARLVDPAGKTRELALTLRVKSDRWQLVVPASAVEKYATQIQVSEPRR